MLTLSRRVGETIYIGDDICVTVYDRLRYHLILGVLMPANTDLRYGATRLRPQSCPAANAATC